jgi:hypothetical protein
MLLHAAVAGNMGRTSMVTTGSIRATTTEVNVASLEFGFCLLGNRRNATGVRCVDRAKSISKTGTILHGGYTSLYVLCMERHTQRVESIGVFVSKDNV